MPLVQGGEPVAFMHIRFLFEEGVEVLYLYELQLHKSMQRKVVFSLCTGIESVDRASGKG